MAGLEWLGVAALRALLSVGRARLLHTPSLQQPVLAVSRMPVGGLRGRSTLDVDSAGKTMFIALLGTVSLEVALVTRFWTWIFVFFLALSYFLVYPFEVGTGDENPAT